MLLRNLALSGVAVTAADPSGLMGLKESFASANAVVSEKTDPVPASSSSLWSPNSRRPRAGRGSAKHLKARLAGASQADVSQRAVKALGEVSALLDAKAPTEAAAFKMWLRTISSKVADAATEGGTLGFGGVKVSEKEKATLNDIAKALGIAA